MTDCDQYDCGTDAGDIAALVASAETRTLLTPADAYQIEGRRDVLENAAARLVHVASSRYRSHGGDPGWHLLEPTMGESWTATHDVDGDEIVAEIRRTDGRAVRLRLVHGRRDPVSTMKPRLRSAPRSDDAFRAFTGFFALHAAAALADGADAPMERCRTLAEARAVALAQKGVDGPLLSKPPTPWSNALARRRVPDGRGGLRMSGNLLAGRLRSAGGPTALRMTVDRSDTNVSTVLTLSACAWSVRPDEIAPVDAMRGQAALAPLLGAATGTGLRRRSR